MMLAQGCWKITLIFYVGVLCQLPNGLRIIYGMNGLCLDLDADETLASEYREYVDWCKSASASGREQFSPRYLKSMGRSLIKPPVFHNSQWVD